MPATEYTCVPANPARVPSPSDAVQTALVVPSPQESVARLSEGPVLESLTTAVGVALRPEARVEKETCIEESELVSVSAVGEFELGKGKYS